MTEPRTIYGTRADRVHIVLLVLACVAFLIVALLGFGVIDKTSKVVLEDAAGWAGVGLLLLAAAAL